MSREAVTGECLQFVHQKHAVCVVSYGPLWPDRLAYESGSWPSGEAMWRFPPLVGLRIRLGLTPKMC